MNFSDTEVERKNFARHSFCLHKVDEQARLTGGGRSWNSVDLWGREVGWSGKGPEEPLLARNVLDFDLGGGFTNSLIHKT